MSKTIFNDGDPSIGILGTRVLAAWLNKVFSHVHDGQEEDGHAPKIELGHLADAIVARLQPPGSLMMWPASNPPTGWLERNGAAISRSEYAGLYAVIGTTFGPGDGATTFNLPDDRGLFERGWDHGAGIDPGRVFVSVQQDDNKSHLHTVISGGTLGGGTVVDIGADSTPTTINTGSSGGTEARPKNRAYLPIIKY
jgi:microcystin-dependent protein